MSNAVMECSGPLSGWVDALAVWLSDREVCRERAVRTVRTFGRFSSWMVAQELDQAGLDEDLVEKYIEEERRRSGSMVPAAFQYLPLVKHFFADQGLMVLRGPASRDRHGVPRLLVGPLSGVIVDLVAWLKTEGYARGTVASVACTAARLSAWMDGERVDLERLDDALLVRFVAAQTSGTAKHPSSARRTVAVRKYLLAAGLITPSIQGMVKEASQSPVSECVEQWGRYLRDERGLGRATVREYQRWVQGFVTGLCRPDGTIGWDRVETHQVNQYVADQGHGYSIASRRHLVTALRSLLRWAWITSQIDRPTGAMVLRPPGGSVELPRALTTGQVEAIKAAADVATPIGLRDYAVVVMIARLGLRAGEAASLRLEDIDWHRGRVTVHGKGGRVLTLPLPVDVGDAVVAYLRAGRPAAAADRAVFVRMRPPLRAMSRGGVSGVVARLAKRAGLGTVHAHRLRHTAATQVLVHGGSLVEARELLGHARIDTTRIYAKTDLSSLAALVVPWGQLPGVRS